MRRFSFVPVWLVSLLFSLTGLAEQIRVATYNLENYVDTATRSREAKSDASKAKVHELLKRLDPDILAVEEIGGETALQHLQSSLKREGLVYPEYEHVTGFDTNVTIGVLSRWPIVTRRSHANESYLLQGRRLRLTRGIIDVEVETPGKHKLRVLAAHLKSKRQSSVADEEDMRTQEGLRLRQLVEEHLSRDSQAALAVLGDLNDTKDSLTVRTVIGRGKAALVDVRPAEPLGDVTIRAVGKAESRVVTWTHYYAKEDSYERIDFILVSPALAKFLDRSNTYVLAVPDWGEASDHRPILATFDVK
jgi:endonuclease/exonuclease/phosphatase family metal-dependent hydrolase